MDSERLLNALELANRTLTTSAVIVAMSILLYNLSRHTRNRVAHTSASVLACVIFAYLGDVLVSLDPGEEYLEVWLRFQWIGIAFIPAALFHLSDALLATTGRPSRGRRKAVVRLSYGLSTGFALLAILTDVIVRDPSTGRVPRMLPSPGFAIYMAYLVVLVSVALINVVRARRRCLTHYTRRRMTYLLLVFPSPIYGIFPYSLLFGSQGDIHHTALLFILNVANLIIILMLVFMAYPLSFFGSDKPDRVIKSQLLEFMLRGPLTAAAILAVILFLPRLTNIWGVQGNALMPYAAVAVLLFLQWAISLALPILARTLIYTQDQRQAQWIQRLGERLLTESDAAQLLESILAAICDNLRVSTAFVGVVEAEQVRVVQIVGSLVPSPDALLAPELSALTEEDGVPDSAHNNTIKKVKNLFVWRSYWLMPLRYQPLRDDSHPLLLGILGVWGRAPEPDLTPEETHIFETLAAQAAHTLEDMQHQAEIFVILEGLASQMDRMQRLRGTSRYGHITSLSTPADDIISSPAFSDLVKDALRDYWGGPKLTESDLLKLNVVWQEMRAAEDANPVRALRSVLANAIENLKPEGQRSLTTAEWILYNILEMRFLQGRKVRDVALRLAMSESDLYRKQRVAIEEVARRVQQMEREALAQQSDSPPEKVLEAQQSVPEQ